MKTVAIIPARGGSKRIPKKNIRFFCGKPMIAWSIEAAAKSGLFDRIIVSTDSDEIAQVSQKWGAEVPFMRPKELADDYTGTNDVVRYCLQWLLDRGETIEYACCIYATAPFLKVKYLKKGFELLKEYGCAYAFSVSSFSFPIQRSIKIRTDGRIEPMFPEYVPMRSQDLEEAYHDAGQFYWGRAESFIKELPLYAPGSIPVLLPRYLVQDIDDHEDWQMAELMHQALSMMS